MPSLSVALPVHATRASPATALSLLALAASACFAPPRAPLEPEALAASLDSRAPDLAILAEALAAARVAPLAVPAPELSPEDGVPDLDTAAPWHASAFAWEARTRAARHALLAARAAADSAGAPLPVRVASEVERVEDPDQRGRVMVTFDLLGILGLGPSEAAREVADAEVRKALGELEQAVWSARVEVDRARARLATTHAELGDLGELARAVESAAARIEILHRTGRVSDAADSLASLARHRLLHRIRGLEGERARARRTLAEASGLAISSEALGELSAATLVGLEAGPVPELPSRLELLRRSPELRLRSIEYALAEARALEAASRRWPTLELGPHLAWMGGDLLEGILGSTRLPWPGSVGGALAAALQRREAAGDAAEDALLAVEARARAALERLLAAREGYASHARAADEESARAWRASRARFDVDPGALAEWAGALGARVDALGALYRSRLEAIEAALDFQLAVGPAGGRASAVASAEGQP